METIVKSDEDVYREHAAELTRFATSLVGPFDAQDVVTDACLRAFSSGGWRSVTNQRAYLFRTVANTARSRRRSDLARQMRERRVASGDRYDQAMSDLDVLAAVARLSIRQRAVVYLTYWEGMTPSEVAGTLGVSDGSVRRHLARARAHLREELR